MNLNKQLCDPSQPGWKIWLMVSCRWAEAPAAEATMWAERRRGNKSQYQTFTLKISSSETAHTVSFMALSSSSSTVRSPEIALLISGPISCSVRRPAWSQHTQINTFTVIGKQNTLFCYSWWSNGPTCSERAVFGAILATMPCSLRFLNFLKYSWIKNVA